MSESDPTNIINAAPVFLAGQEMPRYRPDDPLAPPMSEFELKTGGGFQYDYLRILSDAINYGNERTDRTGTGTTALFGACMHVDLSNFQVPLLNTKEVNHGAPTKETMWFKNGETDVRWLKANGVSIWDDWVIPSTAVFEAVPPDRMQTGQDMLTWLRCYDPEQYRLWKPYKEEHQIGQPRRADVLTFLTSIGEEPTNQRLVAGSIGDGAYGTAWRNWEDTRIIPSAEAQRYYDRGYQWISDLPVQFQLDPAKPVAIHFDEEGTARRHTVVHRKIDQLANAIELLKTNPDSRRIIVSAWNPGKLEDAVLPPCHSFYQFLSRPLTIEERQAIYGGEIPIHLGSAETYLDGHGVPKRALTLLLYCRSQDYVVGTPFNLYQYGLLAHMVAQCTHHVAEALVWFGADVHLYTNQIELAKGQVGRRPYEQVAQVRLNPKVMNIDDFKPEDVEVLGYEEFHPRINYPVAV